MDSVAVIYNPVAGSSRGRFSSDQVAGLLSDAGFNVELLITRGRGEAADLAAAAAEKHPVVAAVGGDGTVSEVACALAGTGCALAVLPSGSGNDFACGLGIATLRQGVAAAARRIPRPVDVAWFGDRPFVNSAGFFFSGEVSLGADRVSRSWGRLRYPLAAAGSLISFKPTRARWIFPGGETLDGLWTLAEVGNGPRCGGGFRLTPAADFADGRLDFCLARAMGRWDILRLLPRGISGGHLEDPRVLYPRSARAEVELIEPAAVHLDGEATRLPAGRHEFRVDPGALQVLAPPIGPGFGG